MLTIMLLQAAVTTAERPGPVEFNLRSIASAKPCGEPGSINDGEILVCGRRGSDSRYRLGPLDSSRYEPKRWAETTLAGNLKGTAEVEQKELAPGMTSSRIMFKLKLPF